MTKIKLGFAISLDDPVADQEQLAKYAMKRGISLTAAQIFLCGPVNPKEWMPHRKIQSLVDTGIDVYVHGSYFDNPWGPKHGFAKHIIKRELELCDKYKLVGLVVHLQNVPEDEIVAFCVYAQKIIDAQAHKCTLFLEVEASTGPSKKALAQYPKLTPGTYTDAAKLASLHAQIQGKNLPSIGFCIDTAHVWAADIDLATREGAKNYFSQIKPIAKSSPIMIHLNDQFWPRGSGKDRHAALTYGTMWSHYRPFEKCTQCTNPSIDSIAAAAKVHPGTKPIEESGLLYILEWAKKHGVVCILERRPDRPKVNDLPVKSNTHSDIDVIAAIL